MAFRFAVPPVPVEFHLQYFTYIKLSSNDATAEQLASVLSTTNRLLYYCIVPEQHLSYSPDQIGETAYPSSILPGDSQKAEPLPHAPRRRVLHHLGHSWILYYWNELRNL